MIACNIGSITSTEMLLESGASPDGNPQVLIHSISGPCIGSKFMVVRPIQGMSVHYMYTCTWAAGINPQPSSYSYHAAL